MAGVTTVNKDHASHGMGMHTEQLKGKTQQRFFDLSDTGGGFGYPDAFDVDFNKRGEIDCGGLDYLVVAYGNFFQLVLPIEGGHVSVAIERSQSPTELVDAIRRGITGAADGSSS